MIHKDNDVVLSVKHVSKCFEIYDKPRDRLLQMLFMGRKKFYREFWALNDIDFEIHRGECVGIIGRNGAGKSTLLQIITGTLQPTTGSVEINGRIAALLELGSGFNPEFSGRENVFLNAAILGLTREETEEKYQDIVNFADIGGFIDQPVKTYSTGMMVRLAFAVNAFVEPSILIVDEALAVGDLKFQRKCYKRIMDLKKSGVTILLVSHDLESIKQFCSCVVWINDGSVKKLGDPKQLVEEYMVFMMFGEEYIKESGVKQHMHKKKNAGLMAIPHDSDHQESGDVECGVITHYSFYDENDNETFALSHSQKVKCVFRASIYKQIDKPLYGIVFEDIKGRIITGVNNYGIEKPFEPIIGPAEIEVKFSFTMPELHNGKYYIALAISDGVQKDHKRIHRIAGLGPIDFCNSTNMQELPGVVRLPDGDIFENRY